MDEHAKGIRRVWLRGKGGGVSPAVDFINDGLKVIWEEVQAGILCKLVELIIQHLHNLGALIVHNDTLVLVPKHWHREFAAWRPSQRWSVLLLIAHA